MSKKLAARKELRRRATKLVEDKTRPVFDVEDYCFEEQVKFIKDPAKFKTAVCSRRSGKSVSCAADLLDTALKTARCDVAYITLSRRTAKRIIWREILRLNKEFDLGGVPDKTELTLQLPNESMVHVSGAKDEAEIDKFRGMSLKKVYIDEAQSFRAYIEKLVDDILVPALYDYDGTLCLIGTPGPVAAGYFYDMSHNIEWGHHHWTILDNPHIKIKSGKEPSEILAQERKRRGITENDPTYRRESLGQWVHDVDALVFRFDKTLNTYRQIDMPEGKMDYIFGIDIGFNDADAIAVLGYSHEDKNVYLVEEYLKSEQNVTQLVQQINRLRQKYKPIKMVMDAGALGKKIQAEIQTRHGVPLEAAEKTRKLEFIKLLNDDLRRGLFKAYKGSIFEEDCDRVQWDFSNPQRPKISDVYHTDIGDAVLYAWRECKHYFYRDPDPSVMPHTDEYMAKLEEEEAEKMERSMKGGDDIVDMDDMEFIFDDWE
jgi:hypothetical protein